jgi:hypothetical protein
MESMKTWYGHGNIAWAQSLNTSSRDDGKTYNYSRRFLINCHKIVWPLFLELMKEEAVAAGGVMMMEKKFKITTDFAATTTYFAPGTKLPKFTRISPPDSRLKSGNPNQRLTYEKSIKGQVKKMNMSFPKDSAVDQEIVKKFVEKLRDKFPELTDQDIW